MPVEVASLQIDDPQVVQWIRKNPLHQYRSTNRWSLRRAAIKCNVTPTTVSKWEDGTSYPTDENMIMIADAIKIGLVDLNALWRKWFDSKHQKEEQSDGNKKSNKTKSRK